MSLTAPRKFVRWLGKNEHRDRNYGYVYRYHPRSDAHSIALCRFILEDLLTHCASLREQALASRIVYGINYVHRWPQSGKTKTLDLAVGTGIPDTSLVSPVRGVYRGVIDRVLISCESKTVMTEHAKSQPRIYDELSSSHEIVHQGDREVIAAGISVVNIAKTFVSPLRQRGVELHVSQHKQPRAAERMVAHLRGLPVRSAIDGVGFDAYATIVVVCDNQGPPRLWTKPPAPQRTDRDEYHAFLDAISRAYAERFAK
jgi:hypothetical protein